MHTRRSSMMFLTLILTAPVTWCIMPVPTKFTIRHRIRISMQTIGNRSKQEDRNDKQSNFRIVGGPDAVHFNHGGVDKWTALHVTSIAVLHFWCFQICVIMCVIFFCGHILACQTNVINTFTVFPVSDTCNIVLTKVKYIWWYISRIKICAIL